MTADSAQPGKRRHTRRRQSVLARREDDGGVVVTVARLGFGAWSLGTEVLGKRLQATATEPHASVIAERGRRRSRRTPRAVTIGWVAAGATVESAERISRWVSRAADGRRRRRLTRMIARLPGAGVVWMVLQPPIKRYRASVATLRERGRVETRKGRQMVSLLIRDTTRESVRGITESAVKEVAHSPEIAALVRTESVGMATGTILEVRESSEQADDRLERRVRSWLRIHEPEHATTAGAARESAPPTEPAS